jgi:outer membrane protein OmpA-like peptidoglycan-associated protein
MAKNLLKIGSGFAVAVVALSSFNTNLKPTLATSGRSGHGCPEWINPVSDAAGTNDNDDRCDATSPTVVSISRSGSGSSTVGACGPETLTITLSEPSFDFAAEDVVASLGTLTNWNAASSTEYTVVFTPPANSTGSAAISIAAGGFTDVSQNLNIAFTSELISFDTESPTVALTRTGAGSLGVAQTAQITFTLSEPSIDFAFGDVTISEGNLTDWQAVSPTVYTAVFTPPANTNGSAVISVAIGAFTDSCNISKQNVNSGDQFDSVVVTYDTRVVPEPTPSAPAPSEAPTTTSITPAPAIALPTRGSVAAKKSLTAQVLFDLRSARLTPKAKSILKEVASKVSKSTEISIEIVGAVQESKNAPNVNPLSTDRANAVKGFLRSLNVNGTYTIKIIGIVGDTPAARRATLSVFYS